MKRILLVLVLLTTWLTLSASDRTEPPIPDSNRVNLYCIKPPNLNAGDRVALISPSYFSPMEEVMRSAEVLRSWGLVPVVGPNVGKMYAGKYAGTPEERLSDIMWALNDTTIKAVICNRGGYGSIQFVNQISLTQWGLHPKWLVGFSDISTIHGLLAHAGVMSIHGTMGLFLAEGGTDESSTLMRDLLMGIVPCYKTPPHPQNIEGCASGILIGGNLCTFAPNLGTQADATLGDDLILFIEEVDETMHNVDRQFNILALNGVLDRCKGVVLGDFTDCDNEFTFESIEAMLHKYIEAYNIPLLCGFPAGHGDVNLPLIMGAPVTLDVRSDGATLRFDIDGQTQVVNTANIRTSSNTKTSPSE